MRYVTWDPRNGYRVHDGDWSHPLTDDQAGREERAGTPFRDLPLGRVNARRSLVSKAQRAIGLSPDTRALKRELRDGNPYVLAFLHRRGLVFEDGAIHRAN